jgi:indole-3-glycerol phosphate synthase/phosphoribosylanthranilate isomerase
MAVAASLGLDTLVEAHDADELDRGIGLGARVLGVNARDLSTFAIDRRAQLELVARIPADRVVIAESGIQTRAQGAAAELAGADAVLVGSTLMRAADPAAKLAELLSRPLVKVCGLTREEDVAAAAEAGADLAGFILVPESPRAAAAVLPVPDGMLSVAVWVGDAGVSDADLDQVHTVEAGKVRGREASLLRDGREVARVLDLPWEGTDPGHWRTAAEAEGRIVLAGRLGADNVRDAIAAVRPWAVDAASSLESAPGIKDHDKVRRYVEAARS